MTALSALHIAIPVLNEEQNIPALAEDLSRTVSELGDRFACRILAVDDGSTDGTLAALRAAGATLPLTISRHATNLGPGAAFRTAFLALVPGLREGDVVVTMEGDNTSRRETLLEMIEALTRADVALASPHMHGAKATGVPGGRMLLSRGGSLALRHALGLRRYRTLSSFYRAYRASALRRAEATFGAGILECAGFECMVELLLKLDLVGARTVEVAMPLDWSRRRGASKLRVIRTLRGYADLCRRAPGWRAVARDAGRRRAHSVLT